MFANSQTNRSYENLDVKSGHHQLTHSTGQEADIQKIDEFTVAEFARFVARLRDIDIGCYGGEIRTPTLDALAENGVQLARFFNCAQCCPTRASLMTGLYPHQAGVGDMNEVGSNNELWQRVGSPSYLGLKSHGIVTLPEVLRAAGYQTFMAGKWHLGKAPENWPHARGFDRSFALIPMIGVERIACTMNAQQQFVAKLNGQYACLTDTLPSCFGQTFYLLIAITIRRAKEASYRSHIAGIKDEKQFAPHGKWEKLAVVFG